MNESIHLAVVILPKITGFISTTASLFIIRHIFKKWKKAGCKPFPMTSRLLLSMSMADVGSSISGHILGTWLVPNTCEGLSPPLAAGSQATCTAQAFLFEFLLGAGCLSNLFLAVTYWLQICREKPDQTLLQWKYQLFFVGFPWIYGLAVNAPKSLFASNPPAYKNLWFCQATSGDNIVELMYGVTWFVGFMILFFCIGSLIRFVYVTERKTDRYRISRSEAVARDKTLQVSRQGIFYIVSLLVIFVPLYFYMFIEDLPPWFFVFLACVYPSQGTLNAMVYFRPKYVTERERESRRGSDRRSSIGTVIHVLDITLPDHVFPDSLVEKIHLPHVPESVLRSVQRRKSAASNDGEAIDEVVQKNAVVVIGEDGSAFRDEPDLKGSEERIVHCGEECLEGGQKHTPNNNVVRNAGRNDCSDVGNDVASTTKDDDDDEVVVDV